MRALGPLALFPLKAKRPIREEDEAFRRPVRLVGRPGRFIARLGYLGRVLPS